MALSDLLNEIGYRPLPLIIDYLSSQLDQQSDREKIESLKALIIYSRRNGNLSSDQPFMSQLKDLAIDLDDKDALAFYQFYSVFDSQDVLTDSQSALRKLETTALRFDLQNQTKQKIYYDLLVLELSSRKAFPILESQALHNHFESIKGNKEFVLEQYLILSALRATDLEERIELYEPYLKLCLEYGFAVNSPIVYYNLGRQAALGFHKDLVIELAKRYVEFVEKNQIEAELFYANKQLADGYYNLFQFELAEPVYQRLDQLLPNDPFNQIIHQISKGLNFAGLGKLKLAKDQYRKAEKILNENPTIPLRPFLTSLEADIKLLEGDIDTARKLFVKRQENQLNYAIQEQSKKVRGMRESLQGIIDLEKQQRQLAESSLDDLKLAITLLILCVLLTSMIAWRHFKTSKQLSLANKKLKYYSETDQLSSLYNRGYWEKRFGNEYSRAQRSQSTSALVMLDIDHFKSINDQHGHQVGDTVIQHLAMKIKLYAREVDIPGRYGGEEFVILLPDTNGQQAMVFAERLRQQVEQSEVPFGDSSIKYTVSLGIAELNVGESKDAWLARADDALYQSKHAGRNQSKLATF